jgi:hypothetical protein
MPSTVYNQVAAFWLMGLDGKWRQIGPLAYAEWTAAFEAEPELWEDCKVAVVEKVYIAGIDLAASETGLNPEP